MSLVVNHNLMAQNSARSLNEHFGRLGTSTQRLSSGLRVNSAADDAAGLAIRELQRADVRTLQQGARNANDAISMIQTADGALGVIDEKLIRMRELAEQAATGTYDSTQRIMIHNEFREMQREINRIASATDFNGIKLLDGSRAGKTDGTGMEATGATMIHFGTGNDSAEDFFSLDIGDAHTNKLINYEGIPEPDDWASAAENFVKTLNWPEAKVVGNSVVFEITRKNGGNGSNALMTGFDLYNIPVGLENVRIESSNGMGTYAHKPHVALFGKDGTQLTGYTPNGPAGNTHWNNMTGQQVVNRRPFQPGAGYTDNTITNAGQTVNHGGMEVAITGSQTEAPGWESMTIDVITNDLVFMIGGHDESQGSNNCDIYNLRITADLTNLITGEIPADALGVLLPPSIATQEGAQAMLPRLEGAIVKKDEMRASLGAMQNRLENTISNLNIQAENLQASESRISDTDVAVEMTDMVRNQILSQSATAMLAQANSLPKMAMQILGG